MILSKTCEYAVRAVTVIALLQKGESIGAPSLAEKSDIPLSYLSKILRKLVEADILVARKGPRGGFCVNQPLRQITIMSVLKAVEFEPDLEHCPFGWKKCDGATPCPLHESYVKLKKSYLEWAENTTLQRIAKSQHRDIGNKNKKKEN